MPLAVSGGSNKHLDEFPSDSSSSFPTLLQSSFVFVYSAKELNSTVIEPNGTWSPFRLYA